MSNNATNVRVVFRDSNGNPRANGYLYFYENKTTTLASIYSDELLSIAQENPYRLNANGEIEGDVRYSGKLTVTATNSDGSDPLSDDDVESQGGSTSDSYVDQFKVVENSPADMAVVVKAGSVMNGETLVSIADQTTTLITAPVTNPRIDRIVIDKLTGVYTIVTGSESATPSAPAIPVGKSASAQIALATSTSRITDALIEDERIAGSIEPSNINTTETLNNKTIGDTNTINAQDDAFTIDDAADATLQIDFNVAGTTGTKTTLTSSQTANRVITIPDANDTLVGKTTTDTFSNKTIDSANNTLTVDLSEATITGTTTQFNAALSDGDFATLAGSEVLTNKTLGDTNIINAQDDAFTIDDAADATLQIDFNVAGTTGTKTTLTSSQTANRVITIPDATDTLVGKATTDTLTNKTLGDTNTINAQDDAFTIDDATDATKQIDFDAAGTTGTKTTIASSQTANRTITIPDATDTLVGKSTTDTLTNKTIGDTNTINAQDDAFTIDDAADATKQIDFDAAGTTGTKTTIASSQTANRTVTMPDSTTTLLGASDIGATVEAQSSGAVSGYDKVGKGIYTAQNSVSNTSLTFNNLTSIAVPTSSNATALILAIGCSLNTANAIAGRNATVTIYSDASGTQVAGKMQCYGYEFNATAGTVQIGGGENEFIAPVISGNSYVKYSGTDAGGNSTAYYRIVGYITN